MRRRISLGYWILVAILLMGCSKPSLPPEPSHPSPPSESQAPQPKPQPQPTQSTQPTQPSEPAELALADLQKPVVAFAHQRQDLAHWTVDRIDITQESVVQANGQVEAIYLVEAWGRLAYDSADEVPGIKGRLAFLQEHGEQLTPDQWAKEQRFAFDLRQELQEYIHTADRTSWRIKVTGQIDAKGMVPSDTLQLWVETYNDFIPADQFLAMLRTPEEAEAAAYQEMVDMYGIAR